MYEFDDLLAVLTLLVIDEDSLLVQAHSRVLLVRCHLHLVREVFDKSRQFKVSCLGGGEELFSLVQLDEQIQDQFLFDFVSEIFDLPLVSSLLLLGGV